MGCPSERQHGKSNMYYLMYILLATHVCPTRHCSGSLISQIKCFWAWELFAKRCWLEAARI